MSRISSLIDVLTDAEEAALREYDAAEAMVIRNALAVLEEWVFEEQRREKRMMALIDRAETLIAEDDTRRREGAAS